MSACFLRPKDYASLYQQTQTLLIWTKQLTKHLIMQAIVNEQAQQPLLDAADQMLKQQEIPVAIFEHISSIGMMLPQTARQADSESGNYSMQRYWETNRRM